MEKSLNRVSVDRLDNILGEKFPVLDDGFIRVIDYMGNDSSIVQAARVSYGEGTKTVSDDRGLIRYMMRHKHTSPFEQCEIKFHIRVPMDCWRQWIRHRTASVNEYSTRYSEAINSMAKTDYRTWRTQSSENKQGSSGFIDPEEGKRLSKFEEVLQNRIWDEYQARLKTGVAREQARKDLSLSLYTEAYWKIDLHNLLHFLKLRLDSHAQHEIRMYAKEIVNIIKLWAPLTWEAFEDYTLNSITFSKQELMLLRGYLTPRGWDNAYETDGINISKREMKEFEAKMEKIRNA